MTGAISQDRQSCQFLFLLDEKLTVEPVRCDSCASMRQREEEQARVLDAAKKFFKTRTILTGKTRF